MIEIEDKVIRTGIINEFHMFKKVEYEDVKERCGNIKRRFNLDF